MATSLTSMLPAGENVKNGAERSLARFEMTSSLFTLEGRSTVSAPSEKTKYPLTDLPS